MLLVSLLTLFYIPVISHAQKDSLSQAQSPAVKLKTSIQKDRILLRWAVDQPIAWQKANIYGFKVERITVVRDGKALKKVEKRSPKNPIKAKPLEEWKDIAQKDDKAAIIAQALYGESFGMSESKQGMGAKFDKADEQNQRFTFSLMAADQSFEAACMAGWGFIDTSVRANEKYLYRVYALVPNMKIDTAKAFVGLSDYHKLPSPIGLMSRFGNKTATLSWDYETFSTLYNAYYIERSEDSVNFKLISDIPLTNLNSASEELVSRMSYTDSLPENDKMYYYRIKGLTSFGEISPASDSIVKGKGRESLLFAPNISSVNFINDSTITLHWVYMEDTSKVFDHFEISQSDQSEGVYKVIQKDIKQGVRQTTINALLPTNYFMVSAVDKKGYKSSSFAYLVQPIDSVPPSVPTGLEGIVNDSGKVQLKWVANKDKDIYGYHVFKCNAKGEEMSLITKEPIQVQEFTDSVSLAMTNSKVYYAVAALDQRFNQSKPCVAVALTKPDKIPPMSPVFTNYKLEDGKVHLTWENSASDDVAFHRIFKRDASNLENNGQWALVKEFKGSDSTTLTDTKVIPESTVSYTIIAIDKSKNESTPSVPLTVVVPKDKKNATAVKNLKAEADRLSKKITLEWKYEEKDVVEYQLYKTSGKTPFTLWKVLDTNNSSIVDTDISPSNIYKYAVRAVFQDGRMSTWKEVKVEF